MSPCYSVADLGGTYLIVRIVVFTRAMRKKMMPAGKIPAGFYPYGLESSHLQSTPPMMTAPGMAFVNDSDL